MDTLFKRWRRDVGLTQKEVSKLLGVSLRSVKEYEAGKHSSTGKRLYPSGPVLRLMTVIKAGMRPEPYYDENGECQ